MNFETQIRLPNAIKKGDLVEAKVRMRHPVRTGLALNADATTKFERFGRGEPAVYIKTVEIFYGQEPISRFDMNSSTSDDPIVGIKFRADREAALRVVAVDEQGTSSEATADVKFSG